jgi:hypothetical protein
MRSLLRPAAFAALVAFCVASWGTRAGERAKGREHAPAPQQTKSAAVRVTRI